MKTYNKNPEAVSLLTPEQYRVTQQDGTERPFQNEEIEDLAENVRETVRPIETLEHAERAADRQLLVPDDLLIETAFTIVQWPWEHR